VNQNIECPKCNHQFDVTDSFKAQVKNEALAEARNEYSHHLKDLKSQKKALESEKQKFILDSQLEMDKKLENEKKRVKVQLKNEQSFQVESLQNELEEKSKQLQEFNKAKAEIGKLKRENSEIASKIEAELQERLTQQLLDEKEKLRVENENHNNMKLLEKDTLIQQQKKALELLQIQLDQGSTQLQGEVQELAIENWLKDENPFDQIDEVKKGVFGADIIQTVNTRDKMNCGVIAYESKRTANWGNDWIDKFKSDMLKSGANVGILVTSVMPKDLDKAGFKDGVWVCSFDEFKTVSKLLRDSIIKIDIAIGSQKNREEKMEILYDYINGDGFKNRIKAIIQSFTNMKELLDKERNAMTRIWASREKELNKVIDNSISIEGEIKSIAGESLKSIDGLERIANTNLLEINI